MIYSEFLKLDTRGFSDIINITEEVKEILNKSKMQKGIINIFVVGSTASVSTIEYEPALVKDMRNILEKLVSEKIKSHHSQTWGDDNGFSHMRATLMGPGITVPIDKGSAILGTWQQVIVIDHDNRPRERKIFVQVIGEK